jgi:hypothetical protein
MIGRDETVTALVAPTPGDGCRTWRYRQDHDRLAVAERMIGAYVHGVWRVDLAPLRDTRGARTGHGAYGAEMRELRRLMRLLDGEQRRVRELVR